MRRSALLFLHAACLIPAAAGSGLTEAERLRERAARNHTWPPTYVPDTPGWKAINDRRFAQVAFIDGSDYRRYNGYIETGRSSITTPNFTETGWGLTRAPEELVEALREGIRKGLEKGPTTEHKVEVIDGPAAWFIYRPDLTRRVLEELKPMHERWSGLELVANNAYGFRLYRNESALHMHVDKPDTHIISSILHIARSEDSEPWPIIIEDYQGNTNEVILESGDMLFYESSKCFHGRPKKFNGSWYTSIFTHYYPVGWDREKRLMDAHFAVPPHWIQDPNSLRKECADSNERCHDWAAMGECKANQGYMMTNCRRSCGACFASVDYANLDRLEMAGTGLKEPDCEHNWCGFRDGTVKWYGPGEKDMVITTGKKYPLWEKAKRSEL